MIILYAANIVFFFAALVFGPVYLTNRYKLGRLNILTIPLVISLPIVSLTTFTGAAFFLEDGLLNPYFQYALLVNNVHTFLATAATLFFIRVFERNAVLAHWIGMFARSGGEVRPERMRVAAGIFFALFLVSFVLLSRSFGLLSWIADPRTGYQLHRTGAGQWYAFSLSFLSLSLALSAIYARTNFAVVLTAPVFLAAVYLLGSKSFIIGFAVFYVVILSLRRFKYLGPVAFVILGVGAVSAIVTFISALGGFGLQEISSYSDYYVNAAMYYRDYLSGKVPLYYGQISLSGLWSVVPRSVYPGKPVVYGMGYIDEMYFPGSVEGTNTPAFITVDYFADFGWPQAVLSAVVSPASVISGFLYAALLPRLQVFNQNRRLPHSRFLLYLFLLISAPFFLFYFDFPLNAILFSLTMGVINLANKLRLALTASEAEVA